MSTYSQNAIPITPVVYSSQIRYVSSFRYAVLDFDMNDQITFRVLLLDQDGQPLEVKTLELSGCDYSAWGNDDSYLVNYITSKLGFSAGSVQFAVNPLCPLYTTDSSNNSFHLAKLVYDGSGNIVLPNRYTTDASNNIVDVKGQIVSYQFLSYNNEGTPVPYGSVSIDASNNPVLPAGAYIDSDGMARDSLGEHIIMISPA